MKKKKEKYFLLNTHIKDNSSFIIKRSRNELQKHFKHNVLPKFFVSKILHILVISDGH